MSSPGPVVGDGRAIAGSLGLRSVVAVCAHPDDESFGLGGILDTLVAGGTSVSVLSFTHGEASTLRNAPGDLADIRSAELAAASSVLGVTQVALFDHPDGRLERVRTELLVGELVGFASKVAADGFVAFDAGGITGHPDHQRATEVAMVAAEALGVPVLGWSVPAAVAMALNETFGTGFVGRRDDEVSFVVDVDRANQRRAIACHASQAGDNPVLWRRLELQGTTELLSWLRHPSPLPS